MAADSSTTDGDVLAAVGFFVLLERTSRLSVARDSEQLGVLSKAAQSGLDDGNWLPYQFRSVGERQFSLLPYFLE